MFYSIHDSMLKQLDTSRRVNDIEQQFLGIITFEEIFVSADGLGIKNTTQIFSNKTPRFESHFGYDIMCFNILDDSDFTKEPQTFYIYFRENLLLFITEDTRTLTEYIDEIANEEIADLTFGRIICLALDKINQKEFSLIDRLEKDISELEELIIISNRKNRTKDIITLRKYLMILKQHYDRLQYIFEIMLENENGNFDKHSLKNLKILSGRIDRINNNIINLRESVTHLREAYEAEVDIQLNSIMKVFTVVTSIFLPLSLITGWYGMNLQMPEYSLSFGYPIIIGLCVAVVGVCVILFKKNKWF